MSRPDTAPVNTPNPALDAKLNAPLEPAAAPVVAPVVAPVAPAAPVEPAAPAPVAPVVPPAAADPAPAAILPVPGITLPEPAAPATPRWQATGNQTLDTIGALFDQKGVDGAIAMSEYNANGEISQETYDDMTSKMGKETADLAFNQFKVAHGELKTAAEADAKLIYEAAGGQETWNQIAQWTQGLEEGKRTEYNKLLQAGGIAAQLAAKELKGQMMADPTFKARADLLGGNQNPAGTGQPAPATQLDRKTYAKQIEAAEMRGDQNAINAVRTAGMAAMKSNPYWKIGNPA